MICVICKHGETAPGLANVVLQRANTTVVIKGVPADICQNCGEDYLTAEMTKKTFALAEAAVARGVEVEVVQFAPRKAS